jgi:glycosyltransferase involved in cell wall biosynthesis
VGTVAHLPTYNDPYQSCLLASLERQGVRARYGRSRALWGWLDLSLVETLLRERGLRILHVHWQHPYLTGAGVGGAIGKPLLFLAQLALLKLLGVRVVWTVHNLWHHDSANPRLEVFFARFLARWADAVIVHSERARAEALRLLRIADAARVHVIPHGSFAAYFPNGITRSQAREDLGIEPDRAVFLFLGLIRPYKGVVELVEAFKALQRDDALLIVAGRAPRPEWAREVEAACAQHSGVRLQLGFVPHEAVQLYMNAADVIVAPYRRVLTSGSVITAMSFGRPVVAPALGCIPDTVDADGAFLYPADAPDGLVGALRSALRARADWARMGAHNRALVDKLDWDRIAQETRSLYARLVA